MFIGVFGAKEFISKLNFKFGVVMIAQEVILGVVMGCQDGIFFIFMYFVNLVSLVL